MMRHMWCSYRLFLFSFSLLITIVESQPPPQVFVGYQDVDFTHELPRFVCEELDCTNMQTRATSMRIYYPTLSEEATKPDDEKDRYFKLCRRRRALGLGAPASEEEIRLHICDADVIRVTANPDVVPLPDMHEYPVILLSSGFGDVPLEYTTLTQEMVRKGFVVVALTHPGIDVVARVNGVEVHQRTDLSNYERILLETADARAAMDKINELNASNDSIFQGILSLAGGFGFMGHSLGGATAMLTAIKDDRIHAVADLDGLFYFGGSNFANKLRTPWLVAGSTFYWGLLYLFGSWAWTTSIPEGSVAFQVNDSGHYSFSDLCHSGALSEFECGTIPPTEMDELILKYVAAFFRLHLQKDEPSRDVLKKDNDAFSAHFYK